MLSKVATHVGAPELLHIDQSSVPRDADCPAPKNAGDVGPIAECIFKGRVVLSCVESLDHASCKFCVVGLDPSINNKGELPMAGRTRIRDTGVLCAIVGFPMRDPVESSGWDRRLGDVVLDEFKGMLLVPLA